MKIFNIPKNTTEEETKLIFDESFMEMFLYGKVGFFFETEIEKPNIQKINKNKS